MITPNGGVFGRNPKFNTVTTQGGIVAGAASSITGNLTLTDGNVVLSSGNGISFAATSDPTIAAVAATGAITRTATNVSNNDTVTVGASTYTFKTALTPANGEVLIGADSTASLLNLARAINNSGGTPGTDYQVAAANASASAGTIVGTVLPLTALTAGTAGNSIALAETSAQLSVSGATLLGGAAAQGMTSEVLNDYEIGTWTPGFTFVTPGDLAIAWDSRSGRYTKIGNTVIAWGLIASTQPGFYHSTASGLAQITGLPYTSIAGSTNQSSVYFSYHNGALLSAGRIYVGAFVNPNSTQMTLVESGASGTSTPFAAVMSVARFPSGTFLNFVFTAIYQAA